MADTAALQINNDPGNPLTIETLPTKDPIELFGLWFKEASECKDISETSKFMTLATASRCGYPSARTVVLRTYSSEGFVFCTDYNSRKGRDLAENNKAALLFFWEPLDRSVRVEGTVEKLPAAASDHCFRALPHGMQIGALANSQSQPIVSRQALVDRFNEFQKKYPIEAGEIERPGSWGGYLVKPEVIEFSQGQPSHLDITIEFEKSDLLGWKVFPAGERTAFITRPKL